MTLKFNDKSRIFGFIGNRGQGKTLAGIDHACINMANGIDVVSNIPIKGRARAKDGKLYDVEARPFIFAEWLFMDEKKRHVHLFWDEVNFLLASARGNSNVNRIYQGMLQQIRHFNISITYTCININRVDTELRNQTDVLVFCKNGIYTKWGSQSNVDPGEYVELRAYDQSGLLSGSVYDPKNPTPGYYSLLYAKPVWNHYNTEYWINPMEGMADVKFAKDSYLINAGHDDILEEDPTYPPTESDADAMMDGASFGQGSRT